MDKSPVPVISLSRGTPDVAKAFLDLGSVEEMENCLKNHVDWKEWKYCVQIKVAILQGTVFPHIGDACIIFLQSLQLRVFLSEGIIRGLVLFSKFVNFENL